MPSLIAIDASHVGPQPAGQGRYTLSLIRALSRIHDEHRYVVYAGTDCREELSGLGRRFQVVNLGPRLMRRLLEPSLMSADMLRRGVDLLHVPCGPAPARSPCPRVVTVHDLAPFVLPQGYAEAERRARQAEITANVGRAAAVIVPSRSAAEDFADVFDLPPERVFVTHEGVDSSFRALDPEACAIQVNQRYDLPPGYLLTSGWRSPGKNRGTLLKALRCLVDQGLDLHLAVVGGRGWLSSMDDEIVRDLDLVTRVHHTGYVPQEDLPLLYSAASIFIFPSLLEGFGMPVLEAMACGTPVITSNVSSLPETAGEAALLVDPSNEESIAAAVHRVFEDERATGMMRIEGIKRAADFSWEACAEQTVAVYREVLGET